MKKKKKKKSNGWFCGKIRHRWRLPMMLLLTWGKVLLHPLMDGIFFFFFSYKVVNLFLEAESSAHKAWPWQTATVQKINANASLMVTGSRPPITCLSLHCRLTITGSLESRFGQHLGVVYRQTCATDILPRRTCQVPQTASSGCLQAGCIGDIQAGAGELWKQCRARSYEKSLQEKWRFPLFGKKDSDTEHIFYILFVNIREDPAVRRGWEFYQWKTKGAPHLCKRNSSQFTTLWPGQRAHHFFIAPYFFGLFNNFIECQALRFKTQWWVKQSPPLRFSLLRAWCNQTSKVLNQVS